MISTTPIRHLWLASIALLMTAALHTASASQVYKCVDPSGKTQYQSQPCPQSSRSVEIDIHQADPFSDLPQISSMSGVRNLITTSCMNAGANNSALQKLYIEQPQKVKGFCECVADYSLSDLEKFKDLAVHNNRTELQRLGMNAAFSCSSRLMEGERGRKLQRPNS